MLNVSMPIRFFLDKVSPCGIDPGNASLEIRDRLFTPGTPLIVGQTEERGRRYAAERKLQASFRATYFSDGLAAENPYLSLTELELMHRFEFC